jgi:hypothetical protein
MKTYFPVSKIGKLGWEPESGASRHCWKESVGKSLTSCAILLWEMGESS